MAYSQFDLENIEAAILALASDQRVVALTIDGVTVQYGLAELDKLRALRLEMLRELKSSAGRPLFYLTITSKGL